MIAKDFSQPAIHILSQVKPEETGKAMVFQILVPYPGPAIPSAG